MPKLHAALVMIFVFALTGCAAVMTRNGISSAKLAETAEIPGMPGVRFWGDEVPTDPLSEIRRRTEHMPAVGRYAKTILSRSPVEGPTAHSAQAYWRDGRAAAIARNLRL